MKKKVLYFLQAITLVLFVVSFLATLLSFTGSSNPLAKLDEPSPSYRRIEAFDPSLSRLNSMQALEKYCDSIYAETVFSSQETEFEKTYTEIVSSAVRDRFYHGYSYYGFSDNYVSVVVSKMTMPGLNALVIPDDILKYPYAACSQQSIVMMEVLKKKGFTTRKVIFNGKKFGGHFAFEVFYDGGWHFCDPNMEPDKSVLGMYGMPAIAYLARNPAILVSAYHNYPKEMVLDILENYSYGPVNKFPAAKAIIFQKVTHFLSYSIWLLFLVAFLFIRRMYTRAANRAFVRESIAAIPRIMPDVTPIHASGEYRAHGS